MAGKHTRLPYVHTAEEDHAWHCAHFGIETPLRGRHHLTCAPAIVKAHYHRWNASTERTYTRKEGHGLVQGR